MTVTADEFLVRLKARVTLPANNELLSNDSLLSFADEVIRDKMVSLFMSVNQNYFVTYELEELVDGQDNYSIPYRSIGRTLRDLKLYQPESGWASDMALIALEDEHLFRGSTTCPGGFYFRGDQIIVVPVPISPSQSLKKFYDLQRSCLVTTSQAVRVTNVVANVVNIYGALPSVIATGATVDFVQGRQGCSTIGLDAVITNATPTQITFGSADDIPGGLVYGDYITLAQTSPVIQFPDEAAPLIVTLTAIRVMHAIGDFEAQSKLEEDAGRQEAALLKMIAPRVEGESTKIINRRGLLRGRTFGSFNWNRFGY